MKRNDDAERLRLQTVNNDNLSSFKRLHQAVFAVKYSDAFYKDSITKGDLAQLGMTILSN